MVQFQGSSKQGQYSRRLGIGHHAPKAAAHFDSAALHGGCNSVLICTWKPPATDMEMMSYVEFNGRLPISFMSYLWTVTAGCFS